MKNMLTRSLRAAGLTLSAVLAPAIASAQDVSVTNPPDTGSPLIGFLVIFLLGVGGLFAVIAAIAVDRTLQSRGGGSARR